MGNVASRAVTPPSPEVYTRLLQADAGPSEWYMYFYLKGLSQTSGEAVIRTSLTTLRVGFGETRAIRMAPNTIRSALENLEQLGLIKVTREQRGVAVYMDIAFL